MGGPGALGSGWSLVPWASQLERKGRGVGAGAGRGSGEGAELAEASGLEPGREEAGGRARARAALRRPGAAGPKGDGVLHGPGIEPGPPAWQARILPLNHPCTDGGGQPTAPNTGPGHSQGPKRSQSPSQGQGRGRSRGRGRGQDQGQRQSCERPAPLEQEAAPRPGGPERRLHARLGRLGAAATAETGGARHGRTEAD